MSYHIYSTSGIVLSYRPWREADRIYNILTRDLGLIRAQGLGVRKEESKLRGALEPVSIASISLVRGKEYWRATSVESIKSIPRSSYTARPLLLLEKLVQGESANPELFDTVSRSLTEGREGSEDFETRLVAEILFHLGYLDEEDLKLDKKQLVRAINKGIEASHL